MNREQRISEMDGQTARDKTASCTCSPIPRGRQSASQELPSNGQF